MNSGEIGAILSGISDKIREGRDEITEIGRRRKAIAFDAHGGDAKAKAELAKLPDRVRVIEREIEDLEAAREEAKRRLNDALAIEGRERKLANLRKSNAAIDKLAEAGRAVDVTADSTAAAIRAYFDVLEEIRLIGSVTEFPGQDFTTVLTDVLQAAFPNMQIFPGLAGLGRRCEDAARRVCLSGADARTLREAVGEA